MNQMNNHSNCIHPINAIVYRGLINIELVINDYEEKDLVNTKALINETKPIQDELLKIHKSIEYIKNICLKYLDSVSLIIDTQKHYKLFNSIQDIINEIFEELKNYEKC